MGPTAAPTRRRCRRRLTRAFRSIDEDRSGNLTMWELKQFLYNSNLVPDMVSDESVETLVKLTDVNGDGGARW